MKAMGIIRKVDSFGRIVIPTQLRKSMNIKIGQAIEVFSDGESILLKKYVGGCSCCGSTENVKEILGIKVCEKCIKEDQELRKIIDSLR